jgi:hypothetical protein
MLPEVADFVRSQVPDPAGISVLEFGALDVNGSMRGYFESRGASYVGVDARPGNGVDKVCNSWDYEGPPVDLVLYLETLEHDLKPRRTLENAWFHLKNGGKVIVTASGFGYPRHDHPVDLWRVSLAGMEELLLDTGFKVDYLSDRTDISEIHAVGLKP